MIKRFSTVTIPGLNRIIQGIHGKKGVFLKPFAIFIIIITFFTISCENNAVDPGGYQNVIHTDHRINFINSSNDSVAVLIDGKFNHKDINDSVITSLTGEIHLTDIYNSKINNELIAFNSNRRPLLIEDLNWNSSFDTIFAFEEQVILPITGWVIYVGNTSFDYAKKRILRAMEDCNRIYAHEGTGLQFDIQIFDASSLEGISDHHNIATVNDMDEVSGFLKAENNMLNLFFTKTVAGMTQGAYTTSLISEFDNRIAFGVHAVNGGTIAHEIGHTLTLLHYDPEIIGLHNVMAGVHTQARVYFSEGQIYRMWFNGESALHTVYNLPVPSRGQNGFLLPDPYLSVWN